MRRLCWLVAALMLFSTAGLASGQSERPKEVGKRRVGRRAARARERARRRARLYIGGPFTRLRGLTAEQREKLAALWAETKKRLEAAAEAEKKALQDYHKQGEQVLTTEQRKALAELRARRAARARARRRKPAETRKPGPRLRLRGPVAQLKDLTDEQIKKINELAARRAEATRAAYQAFRKALAEAEKEFQAGLKKVLNQRQRAALKALIARAKAEREAAARRAAEERRKRTFGGDFRLLKGLSDQQKLALGRLWRQAQEAIAAARKDARQAREEYIEKGKKILTPQQRGQLEELLRKRARRTRRPARKAA